MVGFDQSEGSLNGIKVLKAVRATTLLCKIFGYDIYRNLRFTRWKARSFDSLWCDCGWRSQSR